MQCHYCDSNADVSIEKNRIRVGLCEEHLQEQLEGFEEADSLSELQQYVDAYETKT
ncbi:DUF6757 family protein [Salinibaculum rarum]|uniref:DUF6757 family protein n=1 Tax=Salinibaculum rarum TaxID=3058903 RepID=UPI0034E97D6C